MTYDATMVACWLEIRASCIRERADVILEGIVAQLPTNVPIDLATAAMPELDIWRELHVSAALLEDAADVLRTEEPRWPT